MSAQDALNISRGGQGVGVALLELSRAEPSHDLAEPRRERRIHRAGVGHVLVDMSRQDGHRGLPLEGDLAGHEVEQGQAQRVEVGSTVHLVYGHRLLGGHVDRGPDHDPSPGDVLGLSLLG